MRQLKLALDKVHSGLQSDRFFKFILGFFIFESAWIGLSALYPQAFDENFHFGLIVVYSHYWLPFFSHQPANANAYGAVARDPSFFYHYLMSFPYRLLHLFIKSQTGLVIIFRFIDIALFSVGLVLFRRVLKRIKLSNGLINVSLLLFILIPIVPQLAAQVSYDDLLFPLVGLICLLVFNLTDQILKYQPRFKTFIWLVLAALCAALVKYAFLPILLSIFIYFGVLLYLKRQHVRAMLAYLWQDFKNNRALLKVGTCILLVIGLSMFIERDIVNLIRYHAIAPNCDKVLTIKQCSAYSPWFTDFTRHQQYIKGQAYITLNIFGYIQQWFYWMWYRLFFAINGVASGFYSVNPFPVPAYAAAVIALIGLAALIKWRHRIYHNNPHLVFLSLMTVIYVLALFAQGYSTYHYTAVLENMNGRYLIPVLLPLAAIAGWAISMSLKKHFYTKTVMAIVFILLFFQGGGLLTFILKSDPTWYWPNSTVIKINSTTHKVIKHVVIKSK